MNSWIHYSNLYISDKPALQNKNLTDETKIELIYCWETCTISVEIFFWKLEGLLKVEFVCYCSCSSACARQVDMCGRVSPDGIVQIPSFYTENCRRSVRTTSTLIYNVYKHQWKFTMCKPTKPDFKYLHFRDSWQVDVQIPVKE